ncbi:MAG: hypothetical protein ABI972_25865 [Acidobacteriota bacterium]
MRRCTLALVLVFCALVGVNTLHAQRGTGDWMTSAFDAQRSNWVRNDNKIAPESMAKPGFDFVWSLKFNNTARQLNTTTAPALLDFFISHRGFRTLAFFGGSSDRVFAVDTDLARMEWEFNAPAAGGSAAGTLACPGGMTSAVTRPVTLAYPMLPLSRGMGRGTPAKSAVGEPDQGAVTIRSGIPNPRPAPPPKPVAAPGGTAAAAFNPFAPRIQWLMALTGDGKLHSFYVSNGEEPTAPLSFLPPNANAMGLIAFDNFAYAATVNGCGGVDNGVWALDLTTKKVTQWKSGKNLAGAAGPAVGPDGTLYAASGSVLTALAPKTLKPVGSYKSGGADFTSTPVVFEYKGSSLIAVTSTDGRLHLLDAANLGNAALDKSAPFSTPAYAVGSLTSWQDLDGTRWVLAPTGSAVTAWKVVDKDGKPALEQGWVSRELVSPLPPIVVAGVVFALSSGEFRTNDTKMTAAQIAQKSGKAVLYAIDGATGKELWNSGERMTSFVHSGGLAAGGSRVYVATNDGTQYAFGFPIEH